MKTIVYIDGYNFYYGLLKNTTYKWLDIVALVKQVCHIQNPNIEITKIKFFTAPVITRIASKGIQAQQSQAAYHKALKATYPDILEIIQGYHNLERGYPPKYKKPLDKTDRVEVWLLEEKQTDVNIALQLYRDAVLKNCEQVVLVSSDSDLEPALKLVKQDYPKTNIGLILPRPKSTGSNQRPKNTTLSNLTDWTRSYILEDELNQCQLPAKVATKKKPAIKPDYW